MNADRRKRLDKLRVDLSEVRQAIQEILDEERDAFDAMPEGLQNSERGEKSQEAADMLDNMVCSLEAYEDDLTGIVEG